MRMNMSETQYRVQVTIVEKGVVDIVHPDGKSGGDRDRAFRVLGQLHKAHAMNVGCRTTDIDAGFISNLGDKGWVIQVVEVEA
jgi:hypothetical protein